MGTNKQNPVSGAWGILLAPFIVFGIFLIFSPAKPSAQQVTNYIKGSKDLSLTVDKVISSKKSGLLNQLFGNNQMKTQNSVSYYLDFRKNRYKRYVEFYSNSYKKYFVAEDYSKRGILNVDELKQFTGMVNLAELKDSSFGSVEKPVPVLWLTGIDDTEEAYRHNVTDYLRFFKNRKPFNKDKCAVCAY